MLMSIPCDVVGNDIDGGPKVTGHGLVAKAGAEEVSGYMN